jgi:hypothetical protein
VAFVLNRINEINRELDRLDRDIAEKNTEIDRLDNLGALNARDVQLADRQELFREAEALSAERDALLNQQGDQNSSLGQTAESQEENTQPPTFAGEGVQAFTPNPEPLTDQENNNIEAGFDGSIVEEVTPAVVSSEDDGFDGRLVGEGELQLGSQSDETSDATTKQNELSQQAAVPRSDALFTNVLNNYASSTYRISLYLLTKDQYNGMIENPGSFVPKNLLVQSGGGELNNRHPDFKTVFGIDNFKMYTVVGLNANSKASNTLTFNFDIIEPYGMTLLDRLISANFSTGSENYLEQPYLLQIDFLGNASDSDNDNFNISTKRIPIKFLNMKITPGEGNTVYKISSIAYNHLAFQQTVATVPTVMSINAGTIGGFFDNENAQEDGDEVNSFPATMNEFYRSVSGEEKKFKFPQLKIKFNIDPLFADSKIVNPLTVETTKIPMSADDVRQSVSWGQTPIPKARSEQTFNINAGSNIISVIDRIMQKSDYITSQVKEFNARGEAGDNLDEFKFLDWYKIIPDVKLNQYDNGLAQAYAKEITYNIVPYRTANTRHPDFAKTRISKDNIVRTYNYRYTGKNTDIIDLDINFDTAFFTSQTAFLKNRAGAAYTKRDPEKYENENKTNNQGSGLQDLPNSIVSQNRNAEYEGQVNRVDDFKSVTVSDLAKSIYTSSAGDMLNIQMRIIGDPAFIKQDDMFFNPSRGGYDEFKQGIATDLPVNNTGQIVFDTNQVYVQLLVKSATDIDDTTGIANPNKADTLSTGYKLDSTFSGVYQVLTVESSLSQGQFEQNLQIIKIPNALSDTVENTDVTDATNNISFITTNDTNQNAVTAPVQQPVNVLGIAGNDITALVEASNSPDPGVFPIVNGEGVTESAQQQTQSSEANINNTTVEIQQDPPFSNPAGIA